MPLHKRIRPDKLNRIFLPAIVISLALAALFGFLTAVEFRSSYLQSTYLSHVAQRLSVSMGKGQNRSLGFPEHGPYDNRLGYSRLPLFMANLLAQGYEIQSQAVPSQQLADIIELGLYPPYREKSRAGLTIFDCNGLNLFSTRYPQRVYDDFHSIPPLIVNTLLFIENRELLDMRNPHRNPAVEWDRFAKAVVDRFIHIFSPGHRFAGGSTLATQIEKFRHSPEGRTASSREKFRQMASASLKAYLDGQDTTAVRRQLVVDYLNSVPLAAIAGHGEVNGIGDGLWAVYGADFQKVNGLLGDGTGADYGERARAYKEILSLLIAQRRPAFYLVTNRNALESISNSYLRLMAKEGVITPRLRDAALDVRLGFRQGAPDIPPVSFVQRKAANTVRRQLSNLLGVERLYELDRLDLSVMSTLNSRTQDEVSRLLLSLGDPNYVEQTGLRGSHLLESGDPGHVTYSFTLYEHVGNANLVRIQTDNLDQPLDINEGVKIELGSTAKLRTLATYLEIVARLHEQYAGSTSRDLRLVDVSQSDPLTRWALDYLISGKDRSLKAMVEAAMERSYSASPGETFFTGGGAHRFHNFDRSDDSRTLTVREGFRRSVNLVFIRMMRDIVHYYMYRVPGSTARIFADEQDPARQAYLSRFADKEGQLFLNRFYDKYRGKKPVEQLELLLQGVRQTPRSLAAAFRYVRPGADIGEFSAFLRQRIPALSLSEQGLEQLYEELGPGKWGLQDQGYIARIHPLELWLVAFLQTHPAAGRSDMIRASAMERQEIYRWLFNTQRKNAQDIRIRTLLEVEAFLEIHRVWKKQGYPFASLVPSYATSIGSSADRPSSLAELVGIILNGGVRYPVARIDELHFASGTPYETLFRRKDSEGERVLTPETAAAARSALIDVVEGGTANQVRGAFVKSDGTVVAVGGKTGTGDNRRDVYGRRGELIESRAINRAAVFVFLIGDRFFGTVTAYVSGPAAAGYAFTSSLPVRILKQLAPTLMPVIEGAGPGTSRDRIREWYAYKWGIIGGYADE